MESHLVKFVVQDKKGKDTGKTFEMTLTSIPTVSNAFKFDQDGKWYQIWNTKLEGDDITVYVRETKEEK